MSQFSGPTADALKRKQEQDQQAASAREYVKDVARLLGTDGLDPSDHVVKQVRKVLADAKAQQDRIANAPKPADRRRFSGMAANTF